MKWVLRKYSYSYITLKNTRSPNFVQVHNLAVENTRVNVVKRSTFLLVSKVSSLRMKFNKSKFIYVKTNRNLKKTNINAPLWAFESCCVPFEITYADSKTGSEVNSMNLGCPCKVAECYFTWLIDCVSLEVHSIRGPKYMHIIFTFPHSL